MELEQHGEAAILRMKAGKANAINPAFLARLGALLDEAQALGVRALVVTGYEQFFCAGLDLPHLLPLGRAEIGAFMDEFRAAMLRLFLLPLPVVAAINGHAVAGGCVIALQADVRIMAEGKGRIGLAEVPLGLGLPPVVVETLRAQVPQASLVPIALEGRMLLAGEAQQLGLVQEVAEPDKLIARALEKAKSLAALPADPVAQVKGALRRPAADAVRASSAGDSGRWLDLWFSPRGQESLRAAVARLQR
jgi:enoyl-CoA hydratase